MINNLKNENGITLIGFIIIICLIMFILVEGFIKLCEYVEIPFEDSIISFINNTKETIYTTETFENEKKNVKWKKVANYSNDDYNEEIVIPENDYSSEENTLNTESQNDVYIYNRFYYSQLEEDSKIMYNAIIDNLDKLKSGKYTIDFGTKFNDLLNSEDGDIKLNNYFQSAVNAVLLDNPQIFYLDISKMYLLTKSTKYLFNGTTYEVSLGPANNESYLMPGFDANEIEKAEIQLENIKKEIIKSLKGNNISKIKDIHDYLVDNLDYDSTFSNNNIYNIYGALVKHETVCEGYAKALKYLMDELKIPCVVICGYAQNSKGEIENHAWNYCLIDSKWYAIDATWDDPIIVGGGNASDESRYKYFLKGSNDLFIDHQEDGEIVNGANFSYPTLNKKDY